jgi:hypothetical protein
MDITNAVIILVIINEVRLFWLFNKILKIEENVCTKKK